MGTSPIPPVEVHISDAVLGKLAAIAGHDVPGVEDVEGVFVRPAERDRPAPALRLRLTTRQDTDMHRLKQTVEKQVSRTVRWLTGVRLDAVEVEVVPGAR